MNKYDPYRSEEGMFPPLSKRKRICYQNIILESNFLDCHKKYFLICFARIIIVFG